VRKIEFEGGFAPDALTLSMFHKPSRSFQSKTTKKRRIPVFYYFFIIDLYYYITDLFIIIIINYKDKITRSGSKSDGVL